MASPRSRIVDIRTYNDGDPFGRGDPNVDVHDGYHSLVVRARLIKYNGTHRQPRDADRRHAAARRQHDAAPGSPLNIVSIEALTQMDKWLTAITADKSNKTHDRRRSSTTSRPIWSMPATRPRPARVIGAIEKDHRHGRAAAQLFPFDADPRIAAGAPATDDVFKCELKPIDAKDYKVAPTRRPAGASCRRSSPTASATTPSRASARPPKVVTWASFDKGNGEFTSLDPQH